MGLMLVSYLIDGYYKIIAVLKELIYKSTWHKALTVL